jgi:PucR family transcriptional regulator, purine catabolism regulatory protein
VPTPVLTPLSEVLRLPSVAAAAPEVVAGKPAGKQVRWVHSSEVYEMGGLLAGGELLLTTGLGLQGSGPSQLAGYVDALADAGCVAVAVELGRTFARLPEELCAAARRRDLVLLALHEVVGFERMVEEFHQLLLDRHVASWRGGERVWRELLACVLGRRGLVALVERVAAVARCPAYLVAADGRVVVATDSTAAPTGDAPAEQVEVDGVPWGRLLLAGPATTARTALLERAAVAVALELLVTATAPQRESLAGAVLRDVVAQRFPSEAELRARCEMAGFRPPARGRSVAAAAVAVDRRVPAQSVVRLVDSAARRVLGPCLVGEVGDEVLVVAGVRGALRAALEEVTRQVRQGLQGTGFDVVAIGAGDPVDTLAALPRSVAQAREIVDLARRLGARARVLTAHDISIYRLLAGYQNGRELTEFVREQLGQLLDHDARHGSDLVRTLDVYLASGLAKSRTADTLGIRRQSLYGRLARIEQVLGGLPLDDYEQRTALSLALVAWRLRTGLDPARAGGR